MINLLLIVTNVCSVMSAEHIKEVDPKPGDRFLGFVASVNYAFISYVLILHINISVHLILVSAVTVGIWCAKFCSSNSNMFFIEILGMNTSR